MAANETVEWLKIAGVTGVTGTVLAWFAKFSIRKMIEEGTAAQRSAAESHIITELRSEIMRMTAANTDLLTRVRELQEQLLGLREENADLRLRVHALNYRLQKVCPDE